MAVNPFLGLADRPFLVARQLLADVRVCDILPTAEWFRQRLSTGAITAADLDTALAECREEHPEWFAGLTVEACRALLNDEPAAAGAERRYRTVSELVDERTGTRWTSHIVTDISRHCAGHFDRGQASWLSPWLSLPLYEAWRQRKQLSRRLDQLGIRGFRQLVAALPADPHEAILDLLARLAIPKPHVERFLLAELFSVAGWASFLRYLAWHAEEPPSVADELPGLLAARLACDVALAESSGLTNLPEGLVPTTPEPPDPPPAVLARYLMQVAGEVSHRRGLLADIASVKQPASAGRPTLQMVFCIDVRSEVLRRHLEAQSERVETCGFAGFFGMPLEFVRLGTAYGAAHCPVLLQPAFPVFERLLGASDERITGAVNHRKLLRKGRNSGKAFSRQPFPATALWSRWGSPICRSFSPTRLGLRPPWPTRETTASRSTSSGGSAPTWMARRIPSRSTSGLVWPKACCGTSGSPIGLPESLPSAAMPPRWSTIPTARATTAAPVAAIPASRMPALPPPFSTTFRVRAALAERGIAIPADTWFVAAVHHTTTDEIEFFGPTGCPATHRDEFQKVQGWTAAAGNGNAAGTEQAAGERHRGRCSSGLATGPRCGPNGGWRAMPPSSLPTAAERQGSTSVAARSSTSTAPEKDPEGKVLELIMTAPLVVTSWIGLQYFASAVDNQAFGSGNKVIHDVVGQFGILEGNGGDLRVGLPWQAVHDGTKLQHEPLRLTVIIEASRERVADILNRHAGVRDSSPTAGCGSWLRMRACATAGHPPPAGNSLTGAVAASRGARFRRCFSRRPRAEGVFREAAAAGFAHSSQACKS